MEIRGLAALAGISRHFYNLINPLLYTRDARAGKSSALAFAASKRDMDIARLSISRGGDPNAQEGNTLFSAVSNTDINMVRLLLESGANPDSKTPTREGLPPLLWLLKLTGEDYCGHHHNSPAFRSEYIKERIPIIEALLEYHADLSRVDHSRSTALHLAAAFDCYQLVEHLICNGANIEALDSMGHTPLFIAVINKHLETAKALLLHHADTDRQVIRPPLLFHAIALGNRFDNQMATLLLDHGADPHTRVGEFTTALHGAALVGDIEIARRLVEMGVEVNGLNDRQETPLQLAAATRHISTVQMLLRHDPDLGCRSVFERTKPVDYDKDPALTFLAMKGVDGRKLADIARKR